MLEGFGTLEVVGGFLGVAQAAVELGAQTIEGSRGIPSEEGEGLVDVPLGEATHPLGQIHTGTSFEDFGVVGELVGEEGIESLGLVLASTHGLQEGKAYACLERSLVPLDDGLEVRFC